MSGTIQEERQTLHIMDGLKRLAMVETKTVDAGSPVAPLLPMQRYQLGNHLGSAMLELDETGLVISYEEYHPYGSSAYRSARSGVEVSARRYRYVGMERDDETGLYLMGARYYACWLGRWTSADPMGIGADGPGLYNYTRGSPVTLVDPSGHGGFLDDLVEKARKARREIGKGLEQAKEAAEEIGEGIDRYKAAKGTPVERIKAALVPTLPSIIIHPDSVTEEDIRKSIAPVRGNDELQKLKAALSKGDLAGATESALNIDDAAHETMGWLAGLAGAVAAEEVEAGSHPGSTPRTTSKSTASRGAGKTSGTGKKGSNTGRRAGSGGGAGGGRGSGTGGTGGSAGSGGGGGSGPKLFPNLRPEDYAEELQFAQSVGVKPQVASTDVLEGLAGQRIKWVITKKGQLIVGPFSKGWGTDVSHAILSGGDEVLSAGEALISRGPDGKLHGDFISPYSGHFFRGKPDEAEAALPIGERAFKRLGVTFDERRKAPR